MSGDDREKEKGQTTEYPMTGTNSQPGAAQRQVVPQTPENVRTGEDHKEDGQKCDDGGCI